MSGLSNDVLCFGPFRLDVGERRLSRDDVSLEMSGRYLDALRLLAETPGALITKDRFMAEVWRGVPVTDEALTQCIRTLRRALGDEVARPRFIETVPRHGYRFVAEVTREGSSTNVTVQPEVDEAQRFARQVEGESLLLVTAAGLTGGAGAGLLGGFGYGLLAASSPPGGIGGVSVVLVITCFCLLIGSLGGAGVGAGLGLARRHLGTGALSAVLGGALGGALTGALIRLIGVDAVALITGRAPSAVTGLVEGLIIGGLTAASCWLALSKTVRRRSSVVLAGMALGTAAGLIVTAVGGQMVSGSLAVLVEAQPQAPLAALLGRLPAWAPLVGNMVEGAVFAAALALSFTALRERSPSR